MSTPRLVVAPSHKKAHAVHVANWQACKLCGLCKTRTQVVLFRGHIPCDVLFIGEAPGTVEDVNGWPFIGPAGQLLDQLITDSVCYLPVHRIPRILDSIGITNIVACIPRLPPPTETLDGKTYELGTGQIRPPTRNEAEACAPRLAEIITMCKPSMLVLLGKEAARFTPLALGEVDPKQMDTAPIILSLLHPSHILRMDSDPNQRSNARILAEKRFVIALSEALEKL